MIIESFLIFLSTLVRLNIADDTRINTLQEKKQTESVVSANDIPAAGRGGWDGN